ncbi:peptidoglycan-binding protein [Burkholderia anthina]|uniref:peptidoglycan-binding domain-containing protein n=1 Tax=Burkholderia anthina TaxID=179879 RepID=UPI00158A5EF1|nr:peptidoglycan-binding domain-containing protein [Burkholderia anthina]MBY4865155.1 peptidoglycan-binding protein [Burkholderia anthina]
MRRLQSGLAKIEVEWPDHHKGPALDPKKTDGTFGAATRTAVRLVQREQKLPPSGRVDTTLWKSITGEDWPSEYERSLNLLASFEGHGYTKATNTYDGTGITWGIIGFTLYQTTRTKEPPGVTYTAGPLIELLNTIFTQYPDDMTQAFGKDRASELRAALAGDMDDLVEFANNIAQLPIRQTKLLPEWETGFANLGGFKEVQDLQKERARTKYYVPALADAAEFAKEFSMDCEQTRQFFFDIHVHNGAPGSALKQGMKNAIKALGASVSIGKKLEVMIDVLLTAKKSFAPDTRARLSTIARGAGEVHKTMYHLDGWGFTVVTPPLNHKLGLSVLAFEPLLEREQLELASAAQMLVNPEVAAQNPLAWPANNGTELLTRQDGGSTVVSLSYRPLLRPSDSLALGPDPQALNLAIARSFSQPVGILGVFGASASFRLVEPRLVQGRAAQGYAGLDMNADGGLMLFRQRLATESADDARMDIADIRAGLATCQLIMLFGSHGIESDAAESSTGRLWRALLAPFQAMPIVLGWFGGAGIPSDADAQFVSSAFLSRVRKLDATAELDDICKANGGKIVQAWGEACYYTFAKDTQKPGKQKYLWCHGPFSALDKILPALASVGQSGAGAIDRDGKLWHANPDYSGTGDSMELKA